MREDAALQIAAKLPLHVRRHRPLVVVALAAVGEPGLEVLLDAAIDACSIADAFRRRPRASRKRSTATVAAIRAGLCPLVHEDWRRARGPNPGAATPLMPRHHRLIQQLEQL
jgi:transposase